MIPHYSDERATLYHGDALKVLADLADNSIDAIVTDPPYGLGFMGKSWDTPSMLGQMATGREQRGAYAYGGTHSRGYSEHDGYQFQEWATEWALEALRILKPGGHLLSFGGTRTWHRLAVAVEDAGFEIRDSIAWLYGSGFPKSHNIGKAIDKRLGVERPVLGTIPAGHGPLKRGHTETSGGGFIGDERSPELEITASASPEAKQWEGWGTALKPAHEPIVVGRKPLEGTVAENVLAYGTGGLNIAETRIGTEARINLAAANKPGGASRNLSANGMPADVEAREAIGRWPANVLLDEHTAEILDEQSGTLNTGGGDRRSNSREVYGPGFNGEPPARVYDANAGGASRFFYVAKAASHERPEVAGIKHPTVKPLALMQWLIRLVTAEGDLVLDPFAGSGTTLEAALLEGRHAIGIELTADYLPLIEERLRRAPHGIQAALL